MIVEDEPHSVDLIKFYAAKIPYLNITAVFGDPLDAMEALKHESFDLIFVDQQLPRMTGLYFIQQNKGKAYFIFASAYARYDLGIVEDSVTAYLAKPFPFEKFKEAVDKVQELLDKTIHH
jgi:two-component system, LytTR family, response regulator